MFDYLVEVLVSFFMSSGYFGIFFLMVIESSFVPFPSEVIMIPAGYLAYLGKLNLFLVILFGVLGSVVGALINYNIGSIFGKVILKKKKILFLNIKHLEKAEVFFKKYGSITTFIGRLIFGVRQYISIPAGFARMNIFKFIFFTFLGSLLWVGFLTILGYLVGINTQGFVNIFNIIILGAILFGVIFLSIWYFRRKIKQ